MKYSVTLSLLVTSILHLHSEYLYPPYYTPAHGNHSAHKQGIPLQNLPHSLGPSHRTMQSPLSSPEVLPIVLPTYTSSVYAFINALASLFDKPYTLPKQVKASIMVVLIAMGAYVAYKAALNSKLLMNLFNWHPKPSDPYAEIRRKVNKKPLPTKKASSR